MLYLRRSKSWVSGLTGVWCVTRRRCGGGAGVVFALRTDVLDAHHPREAPRLEACSEPYRFATNALISEHFQAVNRVL